jgi:hypothetical protein
MANLNMLKIFSGHIITTSKMPASAKNQLLNYVKEGTESQVKAFLLDGEIMKDPNDIVCKKIIDERFYSSDLPEKLVYFVHEWDDLLLEEKYREFESGIKKFLSYGMAAVIGAPFGLIIPLALMYLYRHLTDACTKKCGGGVVPGICYNRCYADASEKVINKIKTELSAAGKIPDEKKRNKAVKKLQSELSKWEEKRKMFKERSITQVRARA